MKIILLIIYIFSLMEVYAHINEPQIEKKTSASESVLNKKSINLALIQRLSIPKSEQIKNNLFSDVAKEIDRPLINLLPGKILASPDGYAKIHVPQLARVIFDERFPIPNTGEKVQANQVIAVVEPFLSAVDLSNKKSQYYRAEGEIATLKKEIKRLEKLGDYALKKQLENARIDLDRAEKEKAQLLKTSLGRELIRAPISGIIMDNHLLPGQIAQPNEPIIEIIQPNHFRVEAFTFDYIHADQIESAFLRSIKDPEILYPLKYIGTSPKVSEKNQSLHILFSLDGSHSDLIIGMPVDVLLIAKETIKKVAVPQKSLLKSGKNYSIFIFSKPELIVARPVQVGVFFDGMVEILEGLKSGEKYVSDIETLKKLITLRENKSNVN